MTVILGPNMTTGSLVEPNDFKKPIAVWPARRGGFFTKLVYNYEKDRMEAVTDENYASDGYIVFLGIKPQARQQIKIIKKGIGYAVGQLTEMKAPRPYIGENIFSIDESKFATWPAEKGGFYCRALYSEGHGQWKLVSNPMYRSKGMIIFIDAMPEEKNDYIRIVKVGHNFAEAHVYGD